MRHYYVPVLWIEERLRLGYTQEQLRRPAGFFPERRGLIYWVDPDSGWYSLRQRSTIPRRIQRLLDRGRTWRQITRPPRSFDDKKGLMDPELLPAEFEGEEPAGTPARGTDS